MEAQVADRTVPETVPPTLPLELVPSKIGALAKAYALAKKAMQPLIKETKGHNYKYADIATVYDAFEDIFTEHEIAVWQDHYPFRLDNGALVIEVYTTLIHWPSEQQRRVGPVMTMSKGPNPTPQDIGILITYARRYCLLVALGLAPDDDDAQSLQPKAQSTAEAGHRNGSKNAKPDVPPLQAARETFVTGIRATFPEADQPSAAKWLIQRYTTKATPENVRDASDKLTLDEVNAIVDALRANKKKYQDDWKAAKAQAA